MFSAHRNVEHSDKNNDKKIISTVCDLLGFGFELWKEKKTLVDCCNSIKPHNQFSPINF